MLSVDSIVAPETQDTESTSTFESYPSDYTKPYRSIEVYHTRGLPIRTPEFPAQQKPGHVPHWTPSHEHEGQPGDPRHKSWPELCSKGAAW